MKAGTVFTGIGGFDLGFEQAGIDISWQCEIDKPASEVLREHWNVSNIGDVKDVGRTSGTVDVIAGGFPCQDVSLAGKRAGLAGNRSGLWFEFARVIDELEPGWVVIENVPGLLSSNKGRDFSVIVQWLAERGYGVSWRVLDAQYFGLAQRRKRVFIVGSLGNGRSAEVLFERKSGWWNTPPSREAGQGTPGTFTVRSGKDGGGKGYLGLKSSAMTLGGQPQWVEQHVMAHGQGNAEIVKDGSPSLTCNHEAPILFSTNWDAQRVRIHDANGISPTLQAEEGRGCGVPTIAWEMQHASEAYRETKDGLAPTPQSRMGTGGNQVPMVGVRRLTPLECERLQGFPDGWTASQSDTQRYKQLGNAVAVPVARWIAERIVSCDE